MSPIPKIIHYCWFGPAEFSEKVKYCMRSWKHLLPDYTFMLWNEQTFDLNACSFVRQAYDAGKYAFVSDYVRLHVLEEYGGIYLDTDIEVLQRFDDLLTHPIVLGTDDVGKLTAFMAAQPHTPFFREMIRLYHGMDFLLADGSMNTKVNNEWLQDALYPYGYHMEDRYQLLEQDIVIYPCTFFHAKSLVSGKDLVTADTRCIHHHTLLWASPATRIIRWIRLRLLVPLIGAERYRRIARRLKSRGTSI